MNIKKVRRLCKNSFEYDWVTEWKINKSICLLNSEDAIKQLHSMFLNNRI